MRINRIPGIVVAIDGTGLKKLAVIFTFAVITILVLAGMITSIKEPYRVSSSSLNNLTTHLSGESLIRLIGFENPYFSSAVEGGNQNLGFSHMAFEMMTSFNPDDPRSLLGNELPGFSLFDGEIVVAGEGTNYTNMPVESSAPLEVLLEEREASIEEVEDAAPEPNTKTPAATTNGKKVVFIYQSHTRESFLPHLPKGTIPDNAYHPKVNVSLVGERMGRELEARGIGAQVDKTDITEILQKKGWKHPKSYDASRPVIKEAMKQNEDLKFFFDIHRDYLGKDHTTATINGKEYARTFFVIGGEHPRYEQNKKLAMELHHAMEKAYPGLSRGVTTKSGPGTNGKFNQDLSDNSIIIEMGGVGNNLDELYRTAAAVAEVFSEYYWKTEKTGK